MKYPEKIELDIKLATDRKDREYEIYFNENNFRLSKEVIAEKMETGDFQAVWHKSHKKITVKGGQIDKESFLFAVRELLEDCGWFNEYTVGIVTDIHYEEGFGFYLNISESN